MPACLQWDTDQKGSTFLKTKKEYSVFDIFSTPEIYTKPRQFQLSNKYAWGAPGPLALILVIK